MATTSKTEKIIVGIDDQVIELTGEAKEQFLAERKKEEDAKALLEAKEAERKEARESAIKKLAEIAGLTKEELASIL
jgi:hypothetical protein